MSEIGDAIHEKCLAFGDRVIKLNDYLLSQAVAAQEEYKKAWLQKNRKQTSSISPQPSSILPLTSSISPLPSSISPQVSAVPVHLQSVANISNQLLRSGTSIGANNAEATNAISKADFKSKSFIALKEARESLYWIDLLHRNHYLDDNQYTSIYADCEELVKLLVHRCKKINEDPNE